MILNDLIIKNVYFKYESSESFVLEDLNLKIKPNMSIGIIGPSGSGKSTFVDLLVGLLKPSRGTIKIGTKDIHRNITLWKNFRYVSRDFLTTEVFENIGWLEDNQVDSFNLKKSIKFSGLSKYIEGLPNDINTNVGEAGAKISGGQRQRIGLARAMYKDSKILILDEATSFDSKTENLCLIPFSKKTEQ